MIRIGIQNIVLSSEDFYVFFYEKIMKWYIGRIS